MRVQKITRGTDTENDIFSVHDTGEGRINIFYCERPVIKRERTSELSAAELEQTSPFPLILASAHLYDPYGRDFIDAFAENELTLIHGTIALTDSFLSETYFPLLTK